MHTYALVQPIYITTRFGGANHHHQGIQRHRPKNTAVSGCLILQRTHRYISRPPTKRSLLCLTLYVGSVTFNMDLSLSHKGKCDINSSVLKKEAKYSNVCLTRRTQQCFLVCDVVFPDDDSWRHRNVSEYGVTP